MIRIRNFEVEDYKKIEPKDFYLADPKIRDRDLSAISCSGPMNTLYDDVSGEIVGIVGFQIFWDGVAETWSIMSKNSDKHRVGLARAVKEGMDFYAKAMNLKRLQATCPGGMACGDRWFEFLGFTKEGLMKSFGPDGSDYYLYARIY